MRAAEGSPVPNAEKVVPPSVDLTNPKPDPTAKAVSPPGEKTTSSHLPVIL